MEPDMEPDMEPRPELDPGDGHHLGAHGAAEVEGASPMMRCAFVFTSRV